jgi:restriction system protein
MELAEQLPWTVSLALAAVSYVVLHVLAGIAPRTSPVNPGDFRGFAFLQFVRTIATILQYIVPLLFLSGALASFVRRRHGSRLLADAAGDPVRSIHAISWRDFERIVGASFEKDGFAVRHTGGGSADGGVDLVLTKGRETTLVQCKQWRAQNVGVTTVRELYGVMAARGATHGIVVSAGEFTRDASEFATGRNIELVTGRALAALLRDCKDVHDASTPFATPVCPKCGARMLERVARRGPNAGQPFWGCETFPRCRATLPMI